jgi:hypothetical protein
MSSSAIATKREVNSSSMKARSSDEAGRRFLKLGTAKKSIRPPPERFPTGVQKSYFMLSDAERTVLNKALEKYQPGRSEPVLVGGNKVLKPALRLMTLYRLVIEEIQDGQPVTSYTR